MHMSSVKKGLKEKMKNTNEMNKDKPTKYSSNVPIRITSTETYAMKAETLVGESLHMMDFLFVPEFETCPSLPLDHRPCHCISSSSHRSLAQCSLPSLARLSAHLTVAS